MRTQKQYIDDLNYYSDPRTQGPAKDDFKITLYHDDGSETVHEIPTEWGVCHVCRGEGTHVNPSIDAGGLTSEDFADDPGFAEEYFSGTYDVVCNHCGGKRVEKVPNWDRVPEDIRTAYEKQCAEEAAWEAERRAELIMGC